MKKYVQSIVFGGTCAGLGYVLNHDNSILIEENELLGNDYSQIFRPSGPVDLSACGEKISKELASFLIEYGILKSENLDTLRFLTALNRFVQNHNESMIYLDSALVEIRPSEEIFQGKAYPHEVIFRSNTGINSVYAEKLLDTTARHITERDKVIVEEKILNVFAHHLGSELEATLTRAEKELEEAKKSNPALSCISGISFQKSQFPSSIEGEDPALSEYYIQFHMGSETSDLSARNAAEAFHRMFLTPETLYDAVGFDFDYVCKAKDEKNLNIEWIDPHDYENPLLAFNAGAAYTILSQKKMESPDRSNEKGERVLTYYELREGESKQVSSMPVFEKHYDVIVSGLGGGGSFCAYAVGREGLSVLGLERGNCVGGMSVQGCVNGYYASLPGGAFERADEEVHGTTDIYAGFFNQMDSKKRNIAQMLSEVGVEMSFHSVVIGIYADENRIVGVRALQNGVLHDLSCSYLADGTSDGHLIRIVGMKGTIGRPTDGTIQPFSSVRVFRRKDGNLGRTNDDSGMIDIYHDEDFSRSVIIAHGKHNKDSNPKKERFLYCAPQIGNREGIMMEAEQMITLKDMLDETEWPNVLTYGFSDIDRHGLDRAFDDTLYQDWYVLANMCTATLKFTVPVGAIVPKGWKGFVSASRCIGADNYASSAIRMNRDIYRLGESAGIAVALAIKEGKDSILEVDYEQIRDKVNQSGCGDTMPEAKRVWAVWGKGIPHHGNYPFEWINTWEDFIAGLSSDRPAVALWCTRRIHLGLDHLKSADDGNPAAIEDRMAELLDPDFVEKQYTDFTEKEKKNLRYNAAIALGLIRDERAIPTLRELVFSRDAYFYLDNRRSNALRSVNAICMLGRFQDLEILHELYRILTPGEYIRSMYHRYTKNCYKFSIDTKMNMVYYQYLIYTVQALIEISKKYPSKRSEIFRVLHTMTELEDFAKRITNNQEAAFDSPEDRRIRGIREWIALQESQLF